MQFIRRLSTRSKAARRVLLADQDERLSSYLTKKTFAKSVKHAVSVSALRDIVDGEKRRGGEELSARNITMIAHSVARIHSTADEPIEEQGEFRHAVLDLIAANVNELKTSSSSSLIRAISKWQWDVPAELPNQIARQLFRSPKLKAITLARALPGMANAGVDDPESWERAVKCLHTQLLFTDGWSLSECLSALVTAKIGDEAVFAPIIKLVDDRALSYEPISLSRIALALAKSRSRAPDLGPAFARLSNQAQRQMPLYGPVSLQALTAAFEIVAPGDAPLFAAIGDRVVSIADQFTPDLLEAIRRSFKTIGVEHGALEALPTPSASQ